jgi:hypothetical protein
MATRAWERYARPAELSTRCRGWYDASVVRRLRVVVLVVLLIGLLILWVVSHRRSPVVNIEFQACRVAVAAHRGRVALAYDRSANRGWDLRLDLMSPGSIDYDVNPERSFIFYRPSWTEGGFVLALPMWIPLMAVAIPLVFAWRRRRRRDGVGFAVVTDAAGTSGNERAPD